MASPDPFQQQSRDQSGPWMPVLIAGQRLFNHCYELIGPLGAGGMGLVWQARDTLEGSVCALKFLPGLIALQARELDRLRGEVRIGKQLRHPRLTATFGLEVEAPLAAIVMEYIAGETLRDKLETHPRGFFEPDEISGWLTDILDGLGYLHGEAKRVHRDIKPANIMIDENNRARLLDFGISHRIQESLTRHSKTGGKSGGEAGGSSSTLAYASPQQLSGRPGTAADDLYSFGALVYELLTGTPPYFRGGHELIAHQIKTEALTALMERRQELVEEGSNASTGTAIPEGWETLVKACLAKERESRPKSAEELAGQISQAGRQASSRPGPPPVQQFPKMIRQPASVTASPKTTPSSLNDGTLPSTDLPWYEGAAECPPLAQVSGVVSPAIAPPPLPPSAARTAEPALAKSDALELWNPNAAANWSLLFSPAFGGILHYLNWKSIGDEKQAKISLIWVGSTALLLVIDIIPGKELQPAFLILLIAWYFTSARKQAKIVKEQFPSCSKKSWRWPLILGLISLLLYAIICN